MKNVVKDRQDDVIFWAWQNWGIVCENSKMLQLSVGILHIPSSMSSGHARWVESNRI